MRNFTLDVMLKMRIFFRFSKFVNKSFLEMLTSRQIVKEQDRLDP